MNFVYGMFAGSFLATAFGVAVMNKFPLSIESHPDYRREHNARHMAEFDRDQLASEVNRSKLLLDTYRRSTRDPVNPAGVDVRPDDRIPAPAVPLPVAPNVK